MSSSSKSPKPMTSETPPTISEAVHEGDNALDDSIMHCLWDRTVVGSDFRPVDDSIHL